MARCKAGVTLRDLSPEMVFAHFEVQREFDKLQVEAIISSGGEDVPDHKETSYHYRPEGKLDALDYRTSMLSEAQASNMSANLKARLTHEYDVVNHTKGNRHIHVEFDRRRASKPKEG